MGSLSAVAVLLAFIAGWWAYQIYGALHRWGMVA